MDLKIFWPDFSSVNTLPPKSQCDVLDLSVLFDVLQYFFQFRYRYLEIWHLLYRTISYVNELRRWQTFSLFALSELVFPFSLSELVFSKNVFYPILLFLFYYSLYLLLPLWSVPDGQTDNFLTRVLTQGQKDNVLPYVRPELLNTVMGIRTVLKCPNKVHQRVQRELAVILT